MAAANNKNTFARTYSRHFKPKEEVLSVSSSGEIPVEYENACRLCLEKAAVMMDMFKYQDCLIPIIVKIRSIIALEVNEDDEMPKLICEHCLMQLNEAYTFKKRCLASDAKLRQCLFSRWLPKGLTGPNTEEWSNDNRLCLAEERSSADNKKDSCTIDWNHHVPLATIIESQPNDKNENQQHLKSLDSYFDFDIKEGCQVGGSSDRIEPEVHYEIAVVDIPDEDDDPVELHELEAVAITNDSVESNEDLRSEEKQLPPPEKPKIPSMITKKKKRIRKPHPKTQTVGERQKVPQEAENMLKQIVQRPISDTHVQRKLVAVNIEDVPLAARLKLEKGKGAIKLFNTMPDITIGGVPTEKTEYQCRKCGKTKEDLKSRCANCRVRATKCSVCTKLFLSKSQLNRHLRVHTGERPFKCDQCDLAFSQREILVRHVMQIHTKDMPYVCKICDKGFGMYRLLVSHYSLSHDDNKVYSCVNCPKVFKHPSGLSRHLQFHNGTRYYCKVCLKNFTDSSSVKRHIRLSHLDRYNDKNLIKAISKSDEAQEAITFMIKNQDVPTSSSSSETTGSTSLNN